MAMCYDVMSCGLLDRYRSFEMSAGSVCGVDSFDICLATYTEANATLSYWLNDDTTKTYEELRER
jgi:hypothetical protein